MLSRYCHVSAQMGCAVHTRICQELQPQEGLAWITALRALAIRALMQDQALQLSSFDQPDMATINSLEYPNERLVVCKNPLLAEEPTRKREDLLQATEQELPVHRSNTTGRLGCHR